MLHKVDLKTGVTNSIAANCDHRSRGQCLVYAFAFSCDIMYPEKIHQKHYPDLGSDRLSVWNFCSHSWDVISLRNQYSGGVAECLLFFQARHCLVFANAESTVNAQIMWQDRQRINWGHPRCKNLRNFAFFSSYYYLWLYCVEFSVASLY